MFCSNCGSENLNDATACNKCGKQMLPGQSAITPQGTEKAKRSGIVGVFFGTKIRTALTIAFMVVVVLPISAIVIFFVAINQHNEAQRPFEQAELARLNQEVAEISSLLANGKILEAKQRTALLAPKASQYRTPDLSSEFNRQRAQLESAIRATEKPKKDDDSDETDDEQQTEATKTDDTKENDSDSRSPSKNDNTRSKTTSHADYELEEVADCAGYFMATETLHHKRGDKKNEYASILFSKGLTAASLVVAREQSIGKQQVQKLIESANVKWLKVMTKALDDSDASAIKSQQTECENIVTNPQIEPIIAWAKTQIDRGKL